MEWNFFLNISFKTLFIYLFFSIWLLISSFALIICSVLDSKLTFSLNPSQLLETKPFSCKEERDKLSCCSECASSYEKEAHLFKSGELKLLPPWMQPHGTEASHKVTILIVFPNHIRLLLIAFWNASCGFNKDMSNVANNIYHNCSYDIALTLIYHW